MKKVKGCLVSFITIILGMSAIGYWGYSKITHSSSDRGPMMSYPAEQLKFLESLIAQKKRYDDWIDGKWKNGMNSIKFKEMEKSKKEEYYNQWNPILRQPPMQHWVGIMSRLTVVPPLNQDVGRINFQIFCPITANGNRYALELLPETSIDPSSTLAKSLRDINNGDTVIFSCQMNKKVYFSAETGIGKARRDLTDSEANAQYVEVLSSDDHNGFLDRFGTCHFHLIVENIVIEKVIKPNQSR